MVDDPAPPGSPATSRKSRKRWAVAVAATVLVGAAIGGFVVTRRGESKPLTIHGIFTLTDFEDVAGSWDSCYGTGGYDDVSEGMFLSISDAKGTKVGGTSLRNVGPDDHTWLAATPFMTDHGANEPDAGAVPEQLVALEGYVCVLVWDAEVKPSDFYTIEIGHRGESTYSFKDLKAEDFVVASGLGS